MIALKKNVYVAAPIALLLLGFLVVGYSFFTKGNMQPQNHQPEINSAQLNQPENSTALRDSIVAYGLQFLGTPYTAGGCSQNGFDCSGFVYFVFKEFNIAVPRSSAQFANFGTQIPIDSVKKGDILVFLSPTRNAIGHLGIVTNANGAASDFVHASSGREMKVIVTSLTQPGYAKRFVKAVNVVGKK